MTLTRHTFNTGLSLRLPKDWALERNESGRLFFQDPRDTEGIITFWIDGEGIDMPEGLDWEGLPAFLEEWADKTIAANKRGFGESKILRAEKEWLEDSLVIFFVKRTQEDGSPLTIYAWHRIKPLDDYLALFSFNLVLLTGRFSESDEAALVEAIEWEIHDAVIEAPSAFLDS